MYLDSDNQKAKVGKVNVDFKANRYRLRLQTAGYCLKDKAWNRKDDEETVAALVEG